MNYFINSGLVVIDASGAPQFYEVGQAGETPVKVEREAEERPTPAAARLTATEEIWQRMMEDMLRKLGKANEVQRGLLELQTKKMTEALSFMERTIILAEKNSQLAQHLASFASVSKESQPQEANPETAPDATPARLLRKRKDNTTTTTNQLTAEESEEPTPSALKRVKLERSKQLTRRSGSQGSQWKN